MSMTHAEISRALALAIGYLPEHVRIRNGAVCEVWRTKWWVVFDFRAPSVIWPIAERYNAFPARDFKMGKENGRWWAFKGKRFYFADTAAAAVAMAVIGASK